MTPAETALLAASLTVGALAILITIAAAIRWRPLRRRPLVIAALRTGESVRGVLVARHPSFIELAQVEVLHGAAGASSTVDGTLQVDRDNVTWVQVL